MQPTINTVTRTKTAVILQANSVIRNTYILLSLTLLFSAFAAWMSMAMNAKPMGLLILHMYFGLLLLTKALQNSVWGIVSTFAFTGLLGYTLGPILNLAVNNFSNGPQLVMASLGLTGAIFFALSGYALTTRKDFSYLAGFLFVAATVGMLAGIASFFFQIPMLSLAISAAFVLIASGFILFETSQIVNGGERNYIMATISLYVSIYNLFVSLLSLLMAFAGRRD